MMTKQTFGWGGGIPAVTVCLWSRNEASVAAEGRVWGGGVRCRGDEIRQVVRVDQVELYWPL